MEEAETMCGQLVRRGVGVACAATAVATYLGDASALAQTAPAASASRPAQAAAVPADPALRRTAGNPDGDHPSPQASGQSAPPKTPPPASAPAPVTPTYSAPIYAAPAPVN